MARGRWPSLKRRRWLARRLLRCRQAILATLRLPTTTLLAVLMLTSAHWLLRYSLLYLAAGAPLFLVQTGRWLARPLTS